MCFYIYIYIYNIFCRICFVISMTWAEPWAGPRSLKASALGCGRGFVGPKGSPIYIPTQFRIGYSPQGGAPQGDRQRNIIPLWGPD